jgi:hypothetical protein
MTADDALDRLCEDLDGLFELLDEHEEYVSTEVVYRKLILVSGCLELWMNTNIAETQTHRLFQRMSK